MTLLTFDDVLLEPQYSDIEHRSEIDISQEFLGKTYRLPIISANMNNVTEYDMAAAMTEAGAFYVVHRFLTEEKLFDIFDLYVMNQLVQNDGRISLSVGIREPSKEIHNVLRISKFGGGVMDKMIVTVDTAHGHHARVGDMVKALKDFGVPYVIAGNIATQEGYQFLVDSGADAVKVGIGPGSVCTTREVTGVGVPQFSALFNLQWAEKPIIADGGIKTSGDIVKALAAGADMVMLGSMLAGTTEAPSERRIDRDGIVWRRYVGQSIFGTNRDLYTVEGIEGWVEERGPVSNILDRLRGGIISGLSYVGARDLGQLRLKAKFIEVSNRTSVENGTRVRKDIP